jgi:hypothetical protein
MERDVADSKLREMERIRELEKEAEQQARTRRRFVVDELVRQATELSKSKSLDQSGDVLRQSFLSILEGKTDASLNADAAERKHEFWKKTVIWVSAPAAAVLLFVLFPGIPGMVKRQMGRTIASEKKEGGVFLQEIRQKGMKYQPETDRKYRDNYSDNILYLDDYVKMKLDEKEQTSWTLLLNDFIVGRLSLSDRVIPDFISAEDVMIKDLLHIREGILPQFKEQGLSRMADTEKQESEKLRKLLETPENYKKFRELEKSYYEDYQKRMAGGKEPDRSTASNKENP